MLRGILEDGAKSGWYETALTEPAVTGEKEALSFVESVLAVKNARSAAEEIAGTVVESDSDHTDHKLSSLHLRMHSGRSFQTKEMATELSCSK